MNSRTPPRLTVASFELAKAPDGVPEVSALSFEDGVLRVTLEFSGADRGMVEFRMVRGFRLLDEGDLLEFWSPAARAEGWLWVVESGGWRDQELARPGFLSGLNPTYREYLVLGANDCVSVFSDHAPTFSWLERGQT